MRQYSPVLAALALMLLAAPVRAQVPPEIASRLHTYDTPHYTLHTDISEADAREVDLRMTRIFEEYQRRTAGFSGQVNGKFPFYLFKNPDDYYASGAIPESAGVFIRDQYGSRLMAIAGEHADNETWHIIQHEGFHQFAANVIRGELPIWVNEGLAEYFGEARWTGDSFVTGLIPPQRLAEVNVAILRKTFKPFDKMMMMTADEWGSHLDYANYTQAWAMVHFLAQGENGRYQNAFVQFMQNLNRGMNAGDAWSSVFGNDTKAFENHFEKWWLGLPKNPTRNLYMRAAVSTLTSFLARASLQKQTFPDVETFISTVKLPDLHAPREIWLPSTLFEEVAPVTQKVGTWSIETGPNKMPRLVCIDADGTKYVGAFTSSNNRIQVTVTETPPAKAVSHPNPTTPPAVPQLKRQTDQPDGN